MMSLARLAAGRAVAARRAAAAAAANGRAHAAAATGRAAHVGALAPALALDLDGPCAAAGRLLHRGFRAATSGSAPPLLQAPRAAAGLLLRHEGFRAATSGSAPPLLQAPRAAAGPLLLHEGFRAATSGSALPLLHAPRAAQTLGRRAPLLVGSHHGLGNRAPRGLLVRFYSDDKKPGVVDGDSKSTDAQQPGGVATSEDLARLAARLEQLISKASEQQEKTSRTGRRNQTWIILLMVLCEVFVIQCLVVYMGVSFLVSEMKVGKTTW